VEQSWAHQPGAYSMTRRGCLTPTDAAGTESFVLATPPAKRALTANAPQGRAAQSAPAVAGPVQQKWALVVASAILKTGCSALANHLDAGLRSGAERPGDRRFPRQRACVDRRPGNDQKNQEELNWIARHAQRTIWWSSTWRPRLAALPRHGRRRKLHRDLRHGDKSLDTPDQDALYATDCRWWS